MAGTRKGSKSYVYDKLVWSGVRAKIGWSKVELVMSGAAPLPPFLGEFLKVMSSAHVLQGYGMTESCALGSVTRAEDFRVGHVGIPFDNIEIRLQSVPEMNYLVKDYIVVNGEKIMCP